MTLESLSAQMQRGFRSMDKRFDALENRLDRHVTATREDIAALDEKTEKRFDSVDSQLVAMDGDISDLKRDKDRHDTRLSGVEGILIRPKS